MHTAADSCGGRYAIKAIYGSTSKTHTVEAYTAQEALKAIMTKRTPVGQPRPSAYIVYQGNVPVLTEIARG